MDNRGATCGHEFFPSENSIWGLWEKLEQDTAMPSIPARATGAAALNFAYIHGSGSFEVRQSLLACVETGVGVFFLNQICFPDHPETTELNARALALQERIPDLVKQLGLA